MKTFAIGDFEIAPGTMRIVEMPVSVMSNHTPMSLPVHVLRGAKPGPTLFISGVVHGDEIQGAEIVRRVLRHDAMGAIAGTLLAVPIRRECGSRLSRG
jgi:uncharacterized protein